MAETSIEWTDVTWNPTRGCTVISPGCKHCYAMKIAARFSGPGLAYEGLATMHQKAGGQWTGKLRLVEDALDAPLRWARPRRVFVNSMSDLFHEALTPEQIAEVFAVMYLRPQHTFQLLTKRAQRMREVLTEPGFTELMGQAATRICGGEGPVSGLRHVVLDPAPWVHLGVSVEGPAYLPRLDELMQTPAGLRFVSFEPLLGDMGDLGPWLGWTGKGSRLPAPLSNALESLPDLPGIDWAIVGGESGPGARPLDLEWVRSIVAQCKAAAVAVFVKQLGAKPYETARVTEIDPAPAGDIDAMIERSRTHPTPEGWTRVTIAATGESFLRRWPRLKSKKGGNLAEWPADLRVREFPGVARG